jgi:hypothetical protein
MLGVKMFDTVIFLHAGGGVAMTMAGIGALKFFLSASDFVKRIPGALEAGAAAQGRSADALQSLANRDQERAREQDLVLDHLARNSEEILHRLEQLEPRLKL